MNKGENKKNGEKKYVQKNIRKLKKGGNYRVRK